MMGLILIRLAGTFAREHVAAALHFARHITVTETDPLAGHHLFEAIRYGINVNLTVIFAFISTIDH
jgi:hypothetical protein